MLRQSLLEIDNLAPLSLHRLRDRSPRGPRDLRNQRPRLTNQGRTLVELRVLKGRESQIEQLLAGLKLIECIRLLRLRLLLRHHNHPLNRQKPTNYADRERQHPARRPPVAACQTNTAGQRFSSSTRLKAGGVWRYTSVGAPVGRGRGRCPLKRQKHNEKSPFLPVNIHRCRAGSPPRNIHAIATRLIATTAQHAAVLEDVLAAPTMRKDVIRFGRRRCAGVHIIEQHVANRAMRDTSCSAGREHSFTPVLVLARSGP